MRDPSWLRGGMAAGDGRGLPEWNECVGKRAKTKQSFFGAKADAAFPNFSDFFNFYFFLNGVNAQTVRKPKPKITHKVF